ncbi:MAG TPA: cupin domain-containing protein [Solirubrobacterales bacterium]|nr:cupin domain-containing protein [Solirubrobacterales bacterium]
MPTPYTQKRLIDVKDSAPEFGLGDVQEARFAKDALDAEDTGLSHHRLKPGKRSPFGHRHEKAEEVYIVLGGSGRIKLDDDVIDVEPLDAIRIAPGVTRALEAGPGGIEVLAVGPRHDGDGEMIQGWWSD